MLLSLFVILLILWVLGLMSGYTMGGVIHILPIIAIGVILIQVFRGRRRLHLDPFWSRQDIWGKGGQPVRKRFSRILRILQLG